MQDSLSVAFANAMDFFPRLVLFAVILLVGWFAARLVRSLVHRVLERFKFDDAVARGGLAKLLAPSRTDPADVMAGLGRYAVLLLALQLAFSAFGPNAVSDLLADLVSYLPQVVVALLILVVASVLATAVTTLVRGALVGQPFGPFLARTAQVTVLALGVIAALDQVGIASSVTTPVLVTVLATVGGVIVVGVGGGLIKPMQTRWEHYLGVVEGEVPALKPAADGPSVDDTPTRTISLTDPVVDETPAAFSAAAHNSPPGEYGERPQWRPEPTDALGAPSSSWQQDESWRRPRY